MSIKSLISFSRKSPNLDSTEMVKKITKTRAEIIAYTYLTNFWEKLSLATIGV